MTHQSQHVILGGGILGTTIAKQLAATGRSVRLVTRSDKTHLAGVPTESADITDPASAVRAAKGADVIYFCAAPPYQDWSPSFMALQDGAVAASRATGAVLVAAENLYGYGVAGNLHEDLPLTATTRKGAIRARMSQRLFAAHKAGEIRAVSGRASDFFGPGVRMSALGDRFWPALIKDKPVNWFGNPDALHTFTYLPDFARALTTLGAASDTYGRAWHVPSPDTLTLREVARRAAAMVDAPKPRIRRTPRLLLRLVGLAQPAAAEMIEMEYSFAIDFVMSHHAWDKRFGPGETTWEPALRSTLDAWTAETAATSRAA